ncbi:MAG: YwaF family protein [Clostridia bacterium]|nr:YwaF family protein [Clostridia bacterium]
MFGYSSDDLIVLPVALAIIILTTVILRITLKNKSDRVKEIPLIIISAVLVILEIIKQIINFTGDDFSYFAFPFHYCSLFVFTFPLAHFTKGKVKKFFTPVAYITALAMTLLFYFHPRGIIGTSSTYMFEEYMAFHSVVFHQLVIMYTFITTALKTNVPKKKHSINLMIVMLSYCVFAIIISYVLDTNYCNYLWSVIDPVEALRLELGQVVYTIGISIVVGLGPSLLNLIYYGICNIKKNNK